MSNGDAEIFEPGHRLREAGWAAMRAAPERNDIGWPPEDYQMAITAKRSDWAFVLTQLERWEPYSDVDDRWFYRPARETIVAALGG